MSSRRRRVHVYKFLIDSIGKLIYGIFTYRKYDRFSLVNIRPSSLGA